MRPKFDEETIRYMEMIQGVITRMAANSFSLKGWTVTLVAGILALTSVLTDKKYVWFALVPVLVFWLLDTYYLQLERKYRALFDYIRTEESAAIDFELNPAVFTKYVTKAANLRYGDSFFSKTELWFYVPVGVIVVLFITGVI